MQAGFDTRTFNDLLVVVGNTTWEVMNARKTKSSMGTDQRNQETIVGWRGDKKEVVVPAGLESTSSSLKKWRNIQGAAKDFKNRRRPGNGFQKRRTDYRT